MRLSPKEISSLKSAFAVCLQGTSFKLYLFGSRVDDSKKGGDIDLLVVVGSDKKDQVGDLKSSIRHEIFKTLPEQKSDITVATESELSQDLFLATVCKKAVQLS